MCTENSNLKLKSVCYAHLSAIIVRMQDFYRKVNPFFFLFEVIFVVTGASLFVRALINWYHGQTEDLPENITVAGVILSVAYLARQLRKSNEQDKCLISKEFVLRFTEKKFTVDKFEAIAHLKKSVFRRLKNKEKVDAVKNDLIIHNSIYRVASFFEGMAVFYNENKLDREIIRQFFIPASINIYKKFLFYTKNEREKAKSNFCNWYAMNLDLEKHRDKIRSNEEIRLDGEG